MRKFIKRIKNSILGKILKFIFNIIKWAIELVIITIAIVIVVQRVTNNESSFLGYRIFNVASGSMEPEYVVGDILISKEQDPSTIKVGDNIVYLGNKSDYKGKIITHNVVGIEKNDDGEYLFHTKGIASTVEDPLVHEDQLYGIVVQNNQVLAFICKILTNKYGLYFVVIIPIILYAFVEFVKVQGQKIEEERAEEAKEKQNAENEQSEEDEERRLQKEKIDKDKLILEQNKERLAKMKQGKLELDQTINKPNEDKTKKSKDTN